MVVTIELFCPGDGIFAVPFGVAVVSGTPCAGTDDMLGIVQPEEGSNGSDPEQTQNMKQPVQHATGATWSPWCRGRRSNVAGEVGGRLSNWAIGGEGLGFVGSVRFGEWLIHGVHVYELGGGVVERAGHGEVVERDSQDNITGRSKRLFGTNDRTEGKETEAEVEDDGSTTRTPIIITWGQ